MHLGLNCLPLYFKLKIINSTVNRGYLNKYKEYQNSAKTLILLMFSQSFLLFEEVVDSVIFIVYCKYVQMECSGTLVIQSCLRYGDMENRMPCNPSLFFTNVDKLLDCRFSSAFTSMGDMVPVCCIKKSNSPRELSADQ